MLKEKTMFFVWRCPDCSAVYDGEGLLFLYTDEEHGYCPCGGRLVEGVAPEGEQRYRMVIPERLRDTSLHRQLEEFLTTGENVEVASGYQEDRRINLFSYVG